jgi:3-methyladenine DNA glycosylase AlkD
VATARDVEAALARASEDGVARVARRFAALPDDEVDALLWSEPVENRLAALRILVARFRDGDTAERERIVERYLAAARGERVDDVVLVDASAEHILGDWLVDRPHGTLFALAKSDIVWERRIALLATLASVKRGDAATARELTAKLGRERNDVIATAVERVQREVSKRARDIR